MAVDRHLARQGLVALAGPGEQTVPQRPCRVAACLGCPPLPSTIAHVIRLRQRRITRLPIRYPLPILVSAAPKSTISTIATWSVRQVAVVPLKARITRQQPWRTRPHRLSIRQMSTNWRQRLIVIAFYMGPGRLASHKQLPKKCNSSKTNKTSQ